MLRVYYHLSSYVSHKKAGQLNKQALAAAGIPLVENSYDASTIIIHDDPLLYPALLARNAHWAPLRKIAYTVWESDTLPDIYPTLLQNIDSIWTCSAFSRAALVQSGTPVHIVPHVVNPAPPTSSDLQYIAQRLTPALAADNTPFFFYTIADSYNPRKNIITLLEIFAKHLSNHPNSYLVIKQYREHLDLARLSHVISIDEELSEGQISALHHLCHCYLSAHHSEAWGLSLSDSLAHGKALIATGYSGNMDFMHSANSFPVRYSLENIPPLMCKMLPLFSPHMRWAVPSAAHMAYLMHKVQYHSPCTDITKKAREDMRAYRPEAVGQIMHKLLKQMPYSNPGES